MDILVYLLINGILVLFIILAKKYWNLLGSLGALIGGVLTISAFQAENLIIYTFHDAQLPQNNFEVVTYPMGFFAYVPLILTFFNGVMVFMKKD